MPLLHSMKHRHIDTQEYTLEAIDDIISRGKHRDWLELRDAIRLDSQIARDVKDICEHYAEEQSIRYDFWPVYLRLNGYGYLYEKQQ